MKSSTLASLSIFNRLFSSNRLWAQSSNILPSISSVFSRCRDQFRVSLDLILRDLSSCLEVVVDLCSYFSFVVDEIVVVVVVCLSLLLSLCGFFGDKWLRSIVNW